MILVHNAQAPDSLKLSDHETFSFESLFKVCSSLVPDKEVRCQLLSYSEYFVNILVFRV